RSKGIFEWRNKRTQRSICDRFIWAVVYVRQLDFSIIRGGNRKMERKQVNTARIRVQMKMRGETDETMAKRLNVSRVTYNKLINNKYVSENADAYIETIEKILGMDQNIR